LLAESARLPAPLALARMRVSAFVWQGDRRLRPFLGQIEVRAKGKDVARFGLIDLRTYGEIPSALRTDTPRAM
jgi:hypothetical protein